MTAPPPPADDSRRLETIDRNARLQTQLVEDLLDVSAIITGKFRLDLRPVEIGRVIAAGVESMRSAADDKRLALEWQPGPDVGIVRGDPERLQQICGNLLANAIRFTPEGGRIRVTLTADAHRVQLVVADSGRGIAPEFLPHVFEHFRQEEPATTRRHRGLGLGLAIVRHLVELHGGEVRATSDGLGRGATFTVELPLASPSAAAGWRASGDLVFDELPTLDGVSVLVVDDEPDTRDLLRTILEKRGARVALAAGAREARDLFERTAPRLVLSDVMMPDGDGYELIGWLRARDRTRAVRTPAIALTAYASAQDRARALDAGFDVHVAKPIEPGELVEAVAALMAGRE
jgi:CheY-like chemotaxis protein